MDFYGDYHTHTKYSDGYSTIEENINRACELGLKEIAISEHGLRNVAYSRKKLLKEYEHIQSIKDNYPIKVLFGNEADIISESGELDISRDDIALLDVLTMGFHQFAFPPKFKDWRRLYFHSVLNPIFNKNDSIRKRHTIALIKSIEKYDIDILAHVNHLFFVDPKEVAKACADNNTYLEINVKHLDIIQPILDEILSTDVKLIVNSDAHKAINVGDFSAAYDLIKSNGIENRIANLGKTPTFKKHN